MQEVIVGRNNVWPLSFTHARWLAQKPCLAGDVVLPFVADRLPD